MGLHNKGNHNAAHLAVIAEVDFHGMIGAIEPPGLPFDFGFQKGLGVNPHMLRVPVLRGQLNLIGIATLNLLCADELDLSVFGLIIDQRATEVILTGSDLHFFAGEGLHIAPV